MSRKKKTVESEKSSLPSQLEALLKEAEEGSSAGREKAGALGQRILSLSPEDQEEFFLHFLQKGDAVFPLLEDLIGKDENLDQALADSLGRFPSPRAAQFLQQMAAAKPSKPVIKAIRRSIFRLKTKGISAGEITDQSPPVYHPPARPSSEGYLSPIDGGGDRFVWLARPQIPRGMATFHAVISDTQGIVSFQGAEVSRKDFHEFILAPYREKFPGDIVEADPDYCHGLLEEAFEVGQKKGQAPAGDFLQWRSLMGTAPPLPLRPLIYLHIREEEIKSRPDLADRSVSLFQIPAFEGWFLRAEECQKYLKLFQEASSSILILSPQQKESRVLEIFRQAVEEIFDPPRRSLYRRRLEEMAYILWKTGKEREARISLAAASGIVEESRILIPHPFLLELVKRSLTALLEEEEQKKKDEGLIIRP